LTFVLRCNYPFAMQTRSPPHAHADARWVWLIAVAAILPLLTSLHLFVIPFPLNADEAQFTVTARSSLSDPIVWRSIDKLDRLGVEGVRARGAGARGGDAPLYL
jgi:hypothetical protein